ncbi:MAG: lipoate--protein ligase family protein [Lentisphaerae bacterium]|jgi:lipoate-protein ligase A|nr:lipoate--protein ligase family protein [Lentisphaerota bacterium]
MRFFCSPYEDAVSNAALEEVLFRRRPVEACLLFYRNVDSVLWGRNQNPLHECALQQCLSEKVMLIRRISGGGTVYHDGGNLNYSFVLPRQVWEPTRWVGLVVQALQDLGVPGVYACSRHSIWLDSRKVSGSAFALSGSSVMFHGCILVQTNLDRLEKLLTPEIPARQESSGRMIASVRSPVVNLREVCPTLTIEVLIRAICNSVRKNGSRDLPMSAPELLQLPESELEPYRKKFSDPAWTFELIKR